MNRQTLDAPRQAGRAERVTSTYEDMLHLVDWQIEFVDATKPIMTVEGEPPEPPKQPERERRATDCVVPPVRSLIG